MFCGGVGVDSNRARSSLQWSCCCRRHVIYVSTSVVYRTGSYGRVGLIRCSGTTTSRVHIDVRCSVNRSGCSRNCRSAAVADYGTWRYDVTR